MRLKGVTRPNKDDWKKLGEQVISQGWDVYEERPKRRTFNTPSITNQYVLFQGTRTFVGKKSFKPVCTFKTFERENQHIYCITIFELSNNSNNIKVSVGCGPSQDSSSNWRFKMGSLTNFIILVLTVKGATPKVSPLIFRKVDGKPATGWAPPVISGGIRPLEVRL